MLCIHVDLIIKSRWCTMWDTKKVYLMFNDRPHSGIPQNVSVVFSFLDGEKKNRMYAERKG